MIDVGSVVVCVDDEFPAIFRPEELRRPVKDGVYTVRAIRRYGSETGVLLAECVNKPRFDRFGFYEPSFLIRRFRPAKSTDISLLREILERASEFA